MQIDKTKIDQERNFTTLTKNSTNREKEATKYRNMLQIAQTTTKMFLGNSFIHVYTLIRDNIMITDR